MITLYITTLCRDIDSLRYRDTNVGIFLTYEVVVMTGIWSVQQPAYSGLASSSIAEGTDILYGGLYYLAVICCTCAYCECDTTNHRAGTKCQSYNFRTTPSMPRLGETPYFPMQAGPKGLRGV